MSKFISYGVSLLLILTSCERYAEVQRLAIIPEELDLESFETKQLKLIIEPKQASHHGSVWMSSKPHIAEVISDGFVRGVENGICTVSVTVGDKKATCQVTVHEHRVPAESIILNKKSIELRKTDSLRLQVSFLPMNAIESPVSWASDTPSVASVDKTGLVIAVNPGSAIVTARSGDFSAPCSVTVWDHARLNVECVDLGLSVNWCTTDLGAASPEERGEYYSWGEIAPKTFFDWSNYVYCRGAFNNLSKYCGNSVLGACDHKIQLDLYDDVAYRMIDQDYRIPSSKQWVELLENCLWEEDQIREVKGYRVTCKTDPTRWIFLPYGDAVIGVFPSVLPILRGQYWTSTRVETDTMSEYAWTVMFSSNHVVRIENERCYGMRIRPVKLKK